MKILFIMTTMYGLQEDSLFLDCFQNFQRQCSKSGHQCRWVIAGVDTEKLRAFKTTAKKLYSPTRLNLVGRFNEAFDCITDEDYVILVHDDIFVDDEDWIRKFVDIYQDKGLKCGAIGVQKHTNSFIRKISPMLEQHLRVSGITFVSADIARRKFDPVYVYEMYHDDWLYQLIFEGYRNYRVLVPVRHYQTKYNRKFADPEQYAEKRKEINKDILRFNEKWIKLLPPEKMGKL